MISANELRIGSKVLFAPQGRRQHTIKPRVCTVKILNQNHCVVSDGGLPLSLFYNTDDIQPITITPEILLKLGFKNWSDIFWTKDPHLMLNEDGGWWWTNRWEPDGEFGLAAIVPYKEIHYLHQLQNLYFALTGQEISKELLTVDF